MDAVRADHHVGPYPRAIVEGDDGLLAVLLEANATMARMDDLLWESVHQHLQQVGAMEAVELDLLRELRRPHRSNERPVRAAILRVAPSCAPAQHLGVEAKPPQHANAVRLQRQSGPDFSQGRRLLVDTRVNSAPQQRNGRRHTADAATHNCYAHPRISLVRI